MSAHAKLSASGFKKWARCSMSAAIEQAFPDEQSDFSLEGTCAHGVGETRLRNWLAGTAAGPRQDETLVENYERFFSPEFSGYVQEYVDYCKSVITACRAEHGDANVVVLLEQRLDFSEWVPQGFGTGDVVIITPSKAIVIDLKFGKGVRVEVKGNGQLRMYALGAFHTYGLLYEVSEVEVVVYQPRMGNVDSETIALHGPHGLLTWAEELVRPRAAIAWAALQGDTSQARFAPGEHCSESFCRARFTCAARARYVMELAEMPGSMDEPDTLTVSQLEDVVDRADLIAKWASDCKSYLLKRASDGSAKLDRYELVEGRSNRTITDHEEAAKRLLGAGVAREDIYRPHELASLTVLQKVVGAKRLGELLGDLLHKPPGKPTLALRGSGKEPVEARSRVTATQSFGELD